MAEHESAPQSAILDRANSALRDLFGFPALRKHQEPIVEAVFRGENLLVVMPTGAGKSMIYQLPAFARRGLTIVVSPLIALMKDQVDQLTARGLGSFVATINSTQDFEEKQDVMARVRDQDRPDAIRLLYVAPERFQSRSFMDALEGLPIRLFAVDEAHCISQWGHDFRPQYTRLARAIERLQPKQVLALTATATAEVQEDIVAQIGVELDVKVAGFKRDNLFFEVKPASRKVDKIRAIENLYRQMGAFGIVYCATRRNVESVADALKDQGLKVAAYHGGMDDALRESEQNRFANSKAEIIVATNAFGMGVDKPDVRFIVHYDIPGSIEAYYQESGRAGRDGQPSRCMLLFSPHDLRVQEMFMEGENPTPAAIREVWGKLQSFPGDVIEQTRAEMAEGLTHVSGEAAVSTIIKMLERHDYIKRLFDYTAKAAFRLTGSTRPRKGTTKANLYEFLASDPRSRTVGLNFDLEVLAEQFGVTLETLRHAIKSLEEAGVLHYEPPFRGRAIQIINRCDPEELELDWESLEEKRKAARAKLDQMVQYAELPVCRHRALLTYFGEAGENCGTTCDICTLTATMPTGRTARAANLMQFPLQLSPTAHEAIFDILRLSKKLRGVYGSRRLTQILTGSQDQKVKEWKLHKYDEFGKFGHLTQDVVNAAVDALITAGILELYKRDAEDNFKRCRLSERGDEILARRETDLLPSVPELALLDSGLAAQVRADAEAPLTPPPTPLKGGGPPVVPMGFDRDLYAKLRDVRAELAESEGKPPFFVCSNQTLQAIAASKPQSPMALEAIKGMGPVKVEKYGTPILAAITEFLGGAASKTAPTAKPDAATKAVATGAKSREMAHDSEAETVAETDAENLRYDARRSEDFRKPRPAPRGSTGGASSLADADNALLDEVFGPPQSHRQPAVTEPPAPEIAREIANESVDEPADAVAAPWYGDGGEDAADDDDFDAVSETAAEADALAPASCDGEAAPIDKDELGRTYHMLFFGRTPSEIARVHRQSMETVLRHIEELIARGYAIEPSQLFDPELPRKIRDVYGTNLPSRVELAARFPDAPPDAIRLAIAWLRAEG